MNYLRFLAARTLQQLPAVQPYLPARFEPVGTGHVQNEKLGAEPATFTLSELSAKSHPTNIPLPSFLADERKEVIKPTEPLTTNPILTQSPRAPLPEAPLRPLDQQLSLSTTERIVTPHLLGNDVLPITIRTVQPAIEHVTETVIEREAPNLTPSAEKQTEPVEKLERFQVIELKPVNLIPSTEKQTEPVEKLESFQVIEPKTVNLGQVVERQTRHVETVEHTQVIDRFESSPINTPNLIPVKEPAKIHTTPATPLVTPYIPPEPEISSNSESTPVIHVSIGRIEVRAIHAAPPAQSQPVAKTGPKLSLEDYLHGGAR